jgi:hypothetical protein
VGFSVQVRRKRSSASNPPYLDDDQTLDSTLANHLEANGRTDSELGRFTVADGRADYEDKVLRAGRVCHIAEAPLRPNASDLTRMRTIKLSFHGEHLRGQSSGNGPW